ncbi:hypothetical protein ACQR2B_29800 [Bradyrhizobium oligotrophicum]|uniref:hypothetical protein n=1 Tax=Bradyrhizobium TaxID=374 RepID=UPI003EC109B2
MALVALTSDTKVTEFGHLTPIDVEIDSVILELFYLTCVLREYGSKIGKVYAYHYGVEIKQVGYRNPFDVVALFKNIPKGAAEFVLSRTIFYQQECQKRQAEADKKKAEAEKAHQSAIEKKLANLDKAHKLRQKLIKDGVDIEEASKVVAGLLEDQRANLRLLNHQK